MESIAFMPPPFTLTIDWLAFTLPYAFPFEVMDVLGGEWSQARSGFRGYPDSWTMTADGSRGIGKIGSGVPSRPREVHVDLSGGIVSAWEIPHLQHVLAWVGQLGGHFTRIDCALDDRAPLVTVSQVLRAFHAGQAVTRTTKLQTREDHEVETGDSQGATLYFGSPKSLTRLRVYDKRLELQQKHRHNWQDYGTRWELEFRKERADACVKKLLAADPSTWQEIVVGLLRAYIDFRETSRNQDSAARCRAPLVEWWEELTCGFHKARLTIEKPERSIEEIQEWFKRNLGPILAVLYMAPGLGQTWIDDVISSGAERWKPKHHRLIRTMRNRPKPNTGSE